MHVAIAQFFFYSSSSSGAAQGAGSWLVAPALPVHKQGAVFGPKNTSEESEFTLKLGM